MPKGLKDRVERLLVANQQYRDNDKALILQVWREEGLELTPQQTHMFLKASSADIIVRRRRELMVKYPASAEVTERRYKHYAEFTEEFTKKDYERIIGNRFNKIFKRNK